MSERCHWLSVNSDKQFFFSAPAAGYTFSRVCHQLHVFLRLPPVARFPAFTTSNTFSRVYHRLHVFSRLPPVTRFPAFTTSYTFSRVYHQLHVFPRVPPVTRFPVFITGCTFLAFTIGYTCFCSYYYSLLVSPRIPLVIQFRRCFLRLLSVISFLALDTGYALTCVILHVKDLERITGYRL